MRGLHESRSVARARFVLRLLDGPKGTGTAKEGGVTEFEQWVYEFKRLYRGNGGDVELTYRTLRYLLDLWHEDQSPQQAVDQVRLMMKRQEQG